MDKGWIKDIGLPAAMFRFTPVQHFKRRISWNISQESLISLNYEVTVVVQVITSMLACWSPRNCTVSWLTE